ncbi:hypothetical protein [Aggregatilinea lenta]|uniref:hypothetical protein n=1 Tax=Aggregatilinea lenta TaxID=913108 RepID=UPI0013C2D844|nr:hypothetical protein [Aggregatilinea lenta]
MTFPSISESILESDQLGEPSLQKSTFGAIAAQRECSLERIGGSLALIRAPK